MKNKNCILDYCFLGNFNDTGSGKIRRTLNETVAKTESYIAHQMPDLLTFIVFMVVVTRFWDINDGSIEIGGENIANIEPETLLKSISIVFQDVTLFNNTVLENVRIGKKDATDEEVIKALIGF